jgi:hypothetical protein
MVTTLSKVAGSRINDIELGLLGLALELETFKRKLLLLPGSSLLALSQEELATAIDTFFNAQGIAEDVRLWYERCLEEQEVERVANFEAEVAVH